MITAGNIDFQKIAATAYPIQAGECRFQKFVKEEKRRLLIARLEAMTTAELARYMNEAAQKNAL